MNWLMSIIGAPLGYIMWACYQVVKNYGVALILFTLITRLILLPFAVKQQKNTARMAVMRPKMEALMKQYGDDKQKYQQELLALYNKENYNPMSGCLPMLIQFPILFGLIDVVYKPLTHLFHMDGDLITKMTETANTVLGGQLSTYSPQISVIQAYHMSPESFQFLGEDLVAQLSTFDFNFLGMNLGEIPTFGLNLLLLIPILSGVTNLVYSFYTQKVNEKITPPQAGQTAGMMKSMMIVMPLFSVFFAFQVPAGVGFYWLVSNLMMFGQSVALNKIYDPEKFLEEAKKRDEEEKRLAEEDRKRRRLEAREEQIARQENKKKEKAAPKEKEEGELSEKEKNRRKLAEARRRDAEKYGEEFVDVTDEDLK